MYNSSDEVDLLALERAAKYVCNAKCGRCPLTVEGFACPVECGLDTLPWQCWLHFFRQRAAEHRPPAEAPEAAP